MQKVFFSLIFLALVIGGTLIYQSTRISSSLVLDPHQVREKANGGSLKRIRVGGRVSNDAIEYSVTPKFKLSFSIHHPTDNSETLPVVYYGIKPDMFESGRDVLIDGDFVDGTLMATTLLTQCPSKYEPPTPDEGSK